MKPIDDIPHAAIFTGLALDPAAEIVQMIPGGLTGDAEEIECGTTVLDQSDDGRTVTGLWRCEPCDWAPMAMGERAEFFHVLEGSMIIKEDGQEPREATVGSSVYTPPGWSGTWRVPSRLKKVFVSFIPAPEKE